VLLAQMIDEGLVMQPPGFEHPPAYGVTPHGQAKAPLGYGKRNLQGIASFLVAGLPGNAEGIDERKLVTGDQFTE